MKKGPKRCECGYWFNRVHEGTVEEFQNSYRPNCRKRGGDTIKVWVVDVSGCINIFDDRRNAFWFAGEYEQRYATVTEVTMHRDVFNNLPRRNYE